MAEGRMRGYKQKSTRVLTEPINPHPLFAKAKNDLSRTRERLQTKTGVAD